MTEVNFFDPDFVPEDVLTYSVISARFSGKWIFVRHHLRTSFEIPGGHIEPGESSHEAACRELMEETGAELFTIECVATYSVLKEGRTGWGRLYFAEVTSMGPVPDISEIAEVVTSEEFIQHNTHPDIQPILFEKVIDYLETS